MTVIYNPAGEVIRQSGNLRGLLDHARREVPQAAVLSELPGDNGHVLQVYFANGDRAESDYASATVCAEFLAARRTWPALAVFGPPEFVRGYHARRGDGATLRALLADLISAASRGAMSGNPWRADALKRAAGYLNGGPGDWAGEAYRADLSPFERAERGREVDSALDVLQAPRD